MSSLQGYRSHLRSATRNSPRAIVNPCQHKRHDEKISITRLFADDSLVYRIMSIIRSKEDQAKIKEDLDKL